MNTPENYLVDNPSSNNGMDQAQEYLLQDEKAVIDGLPATTPVDFYPDVNNPTIPYGEYQPRGVVGTTQDYEPFEQWEQKVLRQQKENLVNRTSIHMTPPQNSGINSIPEVPKSSPEKLEKLRKENTVSYLNNELRLLQAEHSKLMSKLTSLQERQRQIRERLEGLN